LSVHNYLRTRASNAILSDKEDSSISSSISTLEERLNSYFGEEVLKQLKFGSSTRGTILPRSMDSNSDIDYMVVFENEDLQPQTYMNKLNKFAKSRYSSSSIYQSSPTVVLELDHIKFELVPAISSWIEEFQIPAPNSSFDKWMPTSPNDFDVSLISANVKSDFKLKPAIRILKFWNAQAGYVFESYMLEKWAANRYYFFCSTVKDYFFSMIEGLSLDWMAAEWRKSKLDRAKRIVENTKIYEADSRPYAAEDEIKKLIPE